VDERAVVLVEGRSDRAALLALARRLDRDLTGEGVTVVPMGGATNVAAHLERFGPHGRDVQVAGLCDAGEERWFRRGLERAGLGAVPSRDALESLGFFVCEADLEDELIRALGTDGVERVIEEQGELPSLHRLRRMPFHRDRPPDATLHRFFGSTGDRKIRYAPLLVAALDDTHVPRPLTQVLAAV
jgi:hypothetical protein